LYDNTIQGIFYPYVDFFYGPLLQHRVIDSSACRRGGRGRRGPGHNNHHRIFFTHAFPTASVFGFYRAHAGPAAGAPGKHRPVCCELYAGGGFH